MTGIKKYSQARRLFLLCISTPANAIHAAMVESYKKYILLSLIELGECPSLPRYLGTVVQRSIRKYVEVYIQLAELFRSNETEALGEHLNLKLANYIND